MEKTSSSDLDNFKIHEKGKHKDPLNAEPFVEALTSFYITPVSLLFHRNHDNVIYQPKVKEAYSEWNISLRVDKDLAKEQGWTHWQGNNGSMFSLLELVEAKCLCKGVQHLDTIATLECAGNRRKELSEGEKAEGIQWGPGVIANIFWSGASIRSLLLIHGIPDPYSHHDNLDELTPSDECIAKDCAIWAQSLHLHLLSSQPDSETRKLEGEFFGASIPLSTAMHPNQQCILAHKHNGETLEQAHGFPVRAIIPGHAGARWVKWLRGLRISKLENDSHPMQMDYKILTPPLGKSQEDEEAWKKKMMGSQQDISFREDELRVQDPMQRLGMGSAIAKPNNDQLIKGRTFKAKGYAVGQDGSQVSSMEYTLLQQLDASESSTSLRDRAEALEVSKWSRANVQRNSADEIHNHKGAEGDAFNTSQDPVKFRWAWTLWDAEIKAASPSQGKEEAIYGLVARAKIAPGIVQEKESPWNVRGFQTRSWPVVRGLRFE